MTRTKTNRKDEHGLLPTPPMPKDLPSIELSDNSRAVLERRYLRRGADGKPVETVDEMFWRVAYHVAKVEEAWGGDVMERAKTFYRLMVAKRFFPNSPTFTGAGTPLGQLAACFVLPISDDMGRRDSGIFQTLRNAALIQQTGGGNGFAFSRLRPKGALVKSSAGQATGPVGFLRVFDHAFDEIAQGGCLLPETLIFTAEGLLRLDEIVDANRPGWQEHKLRVPTDEGLRPSPRGYNNGVARVLRVRTREGLSLSGTPNHKVKVMTESGPQWKELGQLEEGDWMLVQLGRHMGKMQSLRHPNLQHGNQVQPSLPAQLDEDLAFFLGYLAGDGFIASGEKDYRLGVSVAHDSYLMEDMPAMMERLFGVRVHRQQKPDDTSVTFVIDNRAVKEFFQLNGFVKPGSREVFVPALVRRSPAHIVGAFLRGLLEADGLVVHGYPALTTASARLARETAALFIGLGCPVQLQKIKRGLDHWGQAQMYQVRVVSSVGLQAWREHIGCDTRSRFLRAYIWESDERRESAYPLPYPQYWFAPVLEAVTLPQHDRQGRGQSIKFRSASPQLRRRLFRYLRGDRRFTRSAYEALAQAYPEFAAQARPLDDLWFVQVAEVEDIGEHLTLDMEVSGNHTYLAGGIVTHNSRRGANMGVLRVDHPDVEEFITCKTDENAITNFNISVGITDAFMRAVEEDGDWDLVFPDVNDPRYRDFDGTLEDAVAQGIPLKVYKTVKARELFEKIVQQAHHNGEPGLLFLDAANRSNPVPHLYPLESTNPCVTGDTLIYTQKGLRRADALAMEGRACRVTVDGRFGTETFLSATHVFPTGIKPVYRLRTREGYELRLTKDHRLMTERGWVEAGDLQPGDRVHLLNRKGGFGQGGSLEEGLVLGWLVGDSTVNAVRAVLSFFGEEKRELAPAFARMVDGLVNERAAARPRTVGVVDVPSRDEARIGSKQLLPFLERYGIYPGRKHHVPQKVLTGSEALQKGFLQALFAADGYVSDSGEKGGAVRLSASRLELLKDVQRMLLNFGIASRIYENRREAAWRALPDGKGGRKDYFCRAQHELAISKDNLLRFAAEIGFLSEHKQARLVEYLGRMKRGPYREYFLATVASLEYEGMEMVYDLHQPETHSFVANGLVVHNCGEQWLGPYENCCLGSVNLAQHADENGGVDWETLAQSVETAVRFLDDVVDANAYVPSVPQVREAAMRARRIGLGIMGLADLMYRARVRYGSPEGQEFAAQVMEFVRYHAMKTSIALAEERGAFPAIAGSIYDPQNLTWQPPASIVPYTHDWGRPALDWSAIVDGIRTHGIRNAAQTTIAPTGCVVPGTLVSTERGLLPIEALGNVHGTQWQNIDLQVSSEGGVRTANRFYINGRAHTLRIVTRRGYAIQATHGHRIRVFADGKLVWKRLDELQPGMQVPLQSTGLIGARRTVALDTTLETDFQAAPITLPDTMTPELAYLVGVFMGDGSLKERTLRFSLSDMALQTHVAALLEKLFGLKTKVQHDGRSADLVSLEVHSRNLVAFWRRNDFAKKKPTEQHTGKGYTPHIPLAVLQTNDVAVYAAFLAGLFDADGYLHARHLPTWVTTVRDFHDQVKTMLLTLGILTTSDIQRPGMSRAALYRLRAAHAAAAERFQQVVGRYLVRFVVDGQVARRKTLGDQIPILQSEYQVALALADGKEASRLYAWKQHGWQASRTSMQAFVERHRQALQSAGLGRWAEVVEKEMYFDEIAAIEDGGIVATYDLSVPGTHAYHANGFISHNTIATVNGCEGYGCEPVFALAYIRHVNDNGRDLQLTYASPLFEQALEESGLDEATRQEVIAQVMAAGSCQRVEALPEEIRHTFVVSSDISAEEHVRMQAALQAFVDNSISKTINFPATATPEDVATAYKLAWELGCKGITVYVTGSREKVVLETPAAKKEEAKETPAVGQPTLWHEKKKARPRALIGATYSIDTPLGKAFITVNENGGRQPFEVFINTSKAGSETAAVSEAIGRLISYILRLASPIEPRERLREIVRQLLGIGGGRPLGFGPNRIRSLPDGVGQVLDQYLREGFELPEAVPSAAAVRGNGGLAAETPPSLRIGDLCPECGEAAVVNEEGCRKCYACGYSEC